MGIYQSQQLLLGWPVYDPFFTCNKFTYAKPFSSLSKQLNLHRFSSTPDCYHHYNNLYKPHLFTVYSPVFDIHSRKDSTQRSAGVACGNFAAGENVNLQPNVPAIPCFRLISLRGCPAREEGGVINTICLCNGLQLMPDKLGQYQ